MADGAQEDMPPTHDRRRDCRKGTNNAGRVFNLKGCQIWTVVDGNGIKIAIAEGDESGIVAGRHVCRRGIVVATDAIDVTQEGGNDKDLGTGRKRGRKGCPGGNRFFSRIHGR